MSKRRILVTKDDMVLLLSNEDMDTPPEIHEFSTNAAAKLREIGKYLLTLHYEQLKYYTHNFV